MYLPTLDLAPRCGASNDAHAARRRAYYAVTLYCGHIVLTCYAHRAVRHGLPCDQCDAVNEITRTDWLSTKARA